MSPSFSIGSARTPVSSRTSRTAASSSLSSPSGWPLGSASTSHRLRWRAGVMTITSQSRTTTPPAEKSRRRPLLPLGASVPGPLSPSEASVPQPLSVPLLVDVALQRRSVVDGEPPAALGDYSSTFEHRKEAAGGFTG